MAKLDARGKSDMFRAVIRRAPEERLMYAAEQAGIWDDTTLTFEQLVQKLQGLALEMDLL